MARIRAINGRGVSWVLNDKNQPPSLSSSSSTLSAIVASPRPRSISGTRGEGAVASRIALLIASRITAASDLPVLRATASRCFFNSQEGESSFSSWYAMPHIYLTPGRCASRRCLYTNVNSYRVVFSDHAQRAVFLPGSVTGGFCTRESRDESSSCREDWACPWNLREALAHQPHLRLASVISPR